MHPPCPGRDATAPATILGVIRLFGGCRFSLAIAWMYRADYDRAGYAVLPRGELGWSFMEWQVGVPLILLLPLSLTPVLFGRAGLAYLATAVVLGAGFLYLADRLALRRSNAMARRLLFASIIYLPLIFALMVLDRA